MDKQQEESNRWDIVALKFLKKDLSLSSREWLLNKLTFDDDGSERLNCDLVEGTNNMVYRVWADDFLLVERADMLEIKKGHRTPGLAGINSLGIMERQFIILHEIESIHFLWDDTQCKDLPVFHKDQAIFSECKKENVLTYFPVHCTEIVKTLEKIWIKDIFSDQPIDAIQTYFGDSVAMYFAFLGFYTKCLFVPAFVGLLFYFLNFFYTFNVVGYFSLLNVVWCSVFLVLWKRNSTSLAFKWGSLHYTRFDSPRSEFKGSKVEPNPITYKLEPVCDYKSKYYRFIFGSVPIIILFLGVSLFLGFAYFWIEDYIQSINYSDDEHDYRKTPLTFNLWLLAQLLTVTYGILVFTLDFVFRKVAYMLNDWENHKLQQGYDNFLITKLVVFNFINYFHTLFYIAFYMRDFDLLRKNLATLLIIWQIVQHVQVAVIPYLKYKNRKKHIVHVDSDEGLDYLHYQIKKDLAKEEYLSMLDDYLELFFQFGYVFLFSAVYPMAGFVALVSNLIELRVDAFKVCFVQRKPAPKKCDSIGTWLVAFEILGVMAVITNCSLIAMNPDVIQYFKSTRGFSDLDIFITFVIIEHVLISLKAAILYSVSSTPHWIKIKMAERDYKAYETLIVQINKSYASMKLSLR